MTKPIYTYTSIHIKEAFQFEQLLENIFKGMNVSYKRKSEYMEFETDKFTLICAPLFSNNCLPYKRCSCLILDLDYSMIPFAAYDKVDYAVENILYEIHHDTEVIDKATINRIIQTNARQDKYKHWRIARRRDN